MTVLIYFLGVMKLKVYEYTKCGTCRKALKFLRDRGVEFTAMPIREQPPTKAELKKMLQSCGGDIRRLFNTSGLDYKEMNLKDRLPGLSPDQAIDLLARNGNLVKRPFVLTESGGVVGFNEAQWRELF